MLAATRDGQQGLYSVDVTGGAVRRVQAGKFSGAALAPDGRRVASVLRDGSPARLVVIAT